MSFKIQKRKANIIKAEKSRAKKAQKEREALLAEEKDMRSRNIEVCYLDTGENMPYTVSDDEWALLEARHEEAEARSYNPNISVSVIFDDDASIISEGNRDEEHSNASNLYFDDSMDIGDAFDYYDDNHNEVQMRVAITWETVLTKLVSCYFVQIGRLGELPITTSTVNPFECENCEGSFTHSHNVKVFFFEGGGFFFKKKAYHKTNHIL